MDIFQKSCPNHHPDVVSRVVAGEAVVLSPKQYIVRMFNEVGTRIWELADGTKTPAQIATLLVEEYDVSLVEAQTQTSQFLSELDGRGLLIWN